MHNEVGTCAEILPPFVSKQKMRSEACGISPKKNATALFTGPL